MTLNIDAPTESRLRQLVSAALDLNSRNAKDTAFKVCQLLASAMEHSTPETRLAEVAEETFSANLADIAFDDQSAHAPGDELMAHEALVQLRVQRFLTRYGLMIDNPSGRLFPSVCLKCGHEPEAHVLRLESGERDSGWTHPQCADYWPKREHALTDETPDPFY